METLICYTATTPKGVEYAFHAYSDERAAAFIAQNFFAGTIFKRDEDQTGSRFVDNSKYAD